MYDGATEAWDADGDGRDGFVAAAEDDPNFDGLIGCEVICSDQGSRQDAALGSEVLVFAGDCAYGQDEGEEGERRH